MIRRRFFQLGFFVAVALGAPLVVAPALFAADAPQPYDNLLYEKVSEFNHIYVTVNDRGLLTLWFEIGGTMQSVVKLGDPDFLELDYCKVMPAGFTIVEDPKRVLIVGLGGGTLPSFFRKHYPHLKIDVVDIDPDVIDVAKTYFGFREDDNMKVYAKDGRKFIEECKEPYDIIFLDAFGADSIPYDLVTREFLEAVRKAVGPKGVVTANLWDRTINGSYDNMVRTYQEVFDDVCTIDVKHDSHNIILMASPRKDDFKKDDLVQRAKKIVKDKKYPMNLDEFIAEGFRRESTKDPKATILMDKDKNKPKAEKKAA
jgi:spermidine synthase